MVDLKLDVKYIKGVGPSRVKLLNILDIYNLKDLITYYPRDYEDRGKAKNITELIDGEEALVEGYVVSKMSEVRIRKGMTLYKLIIRDESGTCTITWFNQSYLKSRFKIGERYKFFGKVSNKYGKIDMNSPVFDIEGKDKNTGKIIPIYPLTYNLSQNVLRQIIENGLTLINGKLEETLPTYLLEEYHLKDINYAISKIHFPNDFNDFTNARKRLVFEELLSMQIGLLNLKNKYEKEEKGIAFKKEVKMSDVIYILPFQLTTAQRKVLEEIDGDMESRKPMNRLLQGDVGSRQNSNCDGCRI